MEQTKLGWNSGTLFFFGLSVLFLIIFSKLETKHYEQDPLNRGDLVYISFGGSLGEEAPGGLLVWFPQFHLERTDL